MFPTIKTCFKYDNNNMFPTMFRMYMITSPPLCCGVLNLCCSAGWWISHIISSTDITEEIMFVEIVIFVIFLLLFAYYNKSRKWQKFQSRGMPFATPYFPFGSIHHWKVLFTSKGNSSEAYRVGFIWNYLSL